MCYSVSVKAEAEHWKEILEIYRKLSGNEIQKLIHGDIKAIYFANVYKDNHPAIPVITQGEPDKINEFRWGVIPPYAKYIVNDKGELVHPWFRPNYYHTTANARMENLQSSNTWKRLYKSNRCVVLASGFFEFYHAPGKKITYPHYINLKNHPVFGFGGLYDSWVDTESGEVVNTFTIISTKPNAMMSKIHNNPNAYEGPRCPVILTPAEWGTWLDGEFSYQDILQFANPFPEDGMNAHPVRQGLMKRDVDANIPGVLEAISFPELPGDWSEYGKPYDPQASLF